MASYSAEQLDLSGLEATYRTPAGGGDTFPAGNNIFLHLKCGATGATVTIATTATVAGQPVGDVAIAMTTSEEHFVGPFQRQYFANANGLVSMTSNNQTTWTFAVVRL